MASANFQLNIITFVSTLYGQLGSGLWKKTHMRANNMSTIEKSAYASFRKIAH